MDKRMIGKWYKDELEETLNIFDETPPRMKMSLASSGHYDFEPMRVRESDGFLCFEINDEYYRMVYRIKYDDGRLVGSYTQFGKETPVEYHRISDIPEDLPYHFEPSATKTYVAESELTRHELLEKYASYAPDADDEPYETEYVLGGELPDVLEKYGYSSYVSGISPGDDKIAFFLLAFVCDHFGHDGSRGLGPDRDIAGVIAFCEEHDMRTNCRGLALLLASLLRKNGIKARHITCLPFEEPFNDCHVVVDCLLPSGQRIMLDPTQRLYYTDKNGAYVSLEKLRTMLINGEAPVPNADASYNGEAFSADDNIEYMKRASVGMLSEDEHAVIDAAKAALDAKAAIPCTGCNYCVDMCPNKIAIPYNFRAYNMGVLYDNMDLAKEFYAEEVTSYGRRAEHCTSCGTCEEICPQHIKISEWLPKVDELLNTDK